MNEVTIFENAQFGQVRTAGTSEQPLFCLVDVCKVLEIENTRNVKTRLNPRYVHTADVWVKTGSKSDGTPAMRKTKLTFINEPNLYRCIFQSRKKEAEAFQDWVFEEVLPAIRKTGQFSMEEKKRLVAEKKALEKAVAEGEQKYTRLHGAFDKLGDSRNELSRKLEKEEGTNRSMANELRAKNTRISVLERYHVRQNDEIDALKKEIKRMTKERVVAEARHEADAMMSALRNDISEILRSCLEDFKKGGQCNG